MLDQVGWQNLDHCLGGKLVHGLVLLVASGEVAELNPGELVDPLDNLKIFEKSRETHLERSPAEKGLRTFYCIKILTR